MKVVAQGLMVPAALCGKHSFITLFTGAHKSTQPLGKQIKPKSVTILVFNEYIRLNIVLLSAVRLDLRRTLLSSDRAHFNPTHVCITVT